MSKETRLTALFAKWFPVFPGLFLVFVRVCDLCIMKKTVAETAKLRKEHLFFGGQMCCLHTRGQAGYPGLSPSVSGYSYLGSAPLICLVPTNSYPDADQRQHMCPWLRSWAEIVHRCYILLHSSWTAPCSIRHCYPLTSISARSWTWLPK